MYRSQVKLKLLADVCSTAHIPVIIYFHYANQISGVNVYTIISENGWTNKSSFYVVNIEYTENFYTPNN